MEIRFDAGEEFVVVDMGSGLIKAGFSGEDLPRVIMPNVVGEKTIEIDPATQQQMGGGEMKQKKSLKFGNEAFANMNDHMLHYPVEQGIMRDDAHTELMLKYIFENQMNLDTKNINVLMTDAPYNTKKDKQELAELMFEKFKVKSFSLMNTAVLSLFSTGRTTGLVAECGEDITYTVPVFEGYALPHALHHIPVAGKQVTQKLLELLKESGTKVSDEHRQYVRDIKETMCHVAYNFDDELSSHDDPLSEEQRQYELPDSRVIEVGHRQRLIAAEVLFNPSLVNYSYPEFDEDEDKTMGGIAKLAYASIKQCDTDLKINLYNNIVLAGGSTLMNGFYQRFEDELRNFAREDAKTADIHIHAVLHRKNAAWVGGSMISSFSTFKDMAVEN